MRRFLTTALAVLATLLILPFVAAAEGLSVEVSPGKVNKIVKPGETYVQTFRIGNYSGAEKTFYLYTRNFRVVDAAGAPVFDDTEEAKADPRYALTQWMTLPSDKVTVPDGEVRTVDVSIAVPADAEAGGHYGAFFVQTEDPSLTQDQEGSVISSVGRIASLVMVTVPGAVNEKLVLQKFETDKQIYWDGDPVVSFVTSLENAGNVHAIPTGAIFVSGGIGYGAQTATYNKEQGAVLPGAPARTITESLALRTRSLLPPMGKFEAQFISKYGMGGEEIVTARTFYVIPAVFLSEVFAGTFLVVFVMYRAALSFARR